MGLEFFGSDGLSRRPPGFCRFSRLCRCLAALSVLNPASGQAPTQAPTPSTPDRPNILWLVAEDLSPYLATFGDPTVSTPNLDRLAAEGVRYTNVFSVSGVCSPSRAALATGMYPTSIGAHHMRTTYQQPEAREMGIIDYEVVPPPHVRMVSEIMREHGYYTANNSKEDYPVSSVVDGLGRDQPVRYTGATGRRASRSSRFSTLV